MNTGAGGRDANPDDGKAETGPNPSGYKWQKNRKLEQKVQKNILQLLGCISLTGLLIPSYKYNINQPLPDHRLVIDCEPTLDCLLLRNLLTGLGCSATLGVD